MKTSIFTTLVIAISSSACAQMPLPLIDNNKPAPVAAQPAHEKVNIKVNKLMIVTNGGALVALAPRKNDACGTVNFRLMTGQAPGITSAVMLANGVGFEWDVSSLGQPICVARLRPEFVPFLPASTLQVPRVQFIATAKSNSETSEAIEVRSVCKSDVCQFVPFDYKSTEKSTTDKIAAQATALQARIGKLWDATGKLIGSDDCNADYQCQNNDNGTIGETIKPRK